MVFMRRAKRGSHTLCTDVPPAHDCGQHVARQQQIIAAKTKQGRWADGSCEKASCFVFIFGFRNTCWFLAFHSVVNAAAH